MSDLTRRSLLRTTAILSCAPLAGALSGCARRIGEERGLAVGPAVDGNVVVPLAAAHELQQAGGAVVVRPDGDRGAYLVVFSGAGYFALSALCPHAGCELTWVAEDRQAECPCHGSRFAGDGALLNPPATVDLKSYPVDAPDADGNLVVHLFAGDGVFKNPTRNGTFSFALADHPALQAVGGAISGRPDGFPSPLVISRVTAGTDGAALSAVSSVCSHLGCTLLPQPCAAGAGCPPIGKLLQCPCHGSQFDLGGKFLSGPAGTNLLRFAVAFDGVTATVSAAPLPGGG